MISIVFDLDGTLADTSRDMLSCMEAASQEPKEEHDSQQP